MNRTASIKLKKKGKAPALGFVAVFVALYAAVAVWAEVTVGRSGTDTAFQRLLADRGQSFDWAIMGASHALPLAYGDISGRLQEDTGQSAIVLADTGAGPLYNRFVFEQARVDIEIKNLLYIIDSFAFGSAEWNEDRISDRKILRMTPLRASTVSLMLGHVVQDGVDFRALVDYLTCFSKLNDPARFSTQDWRGAENFDRKFRPSRFATEQRIAYLYPDGRIDAATLARYLDDLVALFRAANGDGIAVTVVKMPLPDGFRKALPDEAGFDAALRERIAPLGVVYHDFSASLPDPSLYFDSDHLNRDGVEAFYSEYLLPLLAAPRG